MSMLRMQLSLVDSGRDLGAGARPAVRPAPGQRQASAALARPLIAAREAAELALGPAWRARTPAEQDEFVRLFAALLERALVLRVASAARGAGGLDMRFDDERIEADRATVNATVR